MNTQNQQPRQMPADIRDVARLWRDLISSFTDTMQEDAADWLLDLRSATRAWQAGGDVPDWQDFRRWANDICREDGMPALFDISGGDAPQLSESPEPYVVSNTALTRVLHEGVGACNAEELLAVLIWLPQAERIARELLAAHGSLDRLRAAPVQEIAQVRGMGLKSAGRLKAALEAGRRSAFAPPETRPKIQSPADAAQLLFADLAVCEQEEVWTIHLDTRNRVISKCRVYLGSLNSASIRPADLFREAVRVNAAGVIMAHSHPSGDSQPSPDDMRVTKVIGDAGRLLEVALVDHLIVCAGGRFTSLKERGVEM